MLKNILMGILGAVLVIAIAVSAYTAFASPSVSAPSNLAAGNGNGGNDQGNGQGNGGQGFGRQGNSQGSGIPQANITGATTVHGAVANFDQMGMSLTLDDGTALYVQLGQSRYSQSIGFAPQVGEGVTVYGFAGDQGLFTAIRVTLDSTGQVYSFRGDTGQPLWTGGNGWGNGVNH